MMLINCGPREREEHCIRQELPTPLTGTANEGGRWQEWAARVRWPEVHIKQAGRPRKSRSWLLEPLARLIVWHRSKDVWGSSYALVPTVLHLPTLPCPCLYRHNVMGDMIHTVSKFPPLLHPGFLPTDSGYGDWLTLVKRRGLGQHRPRAARGLPYLHSSTLSSDGFLDF